MSFDKQEHPLHQDPSICDEEALATTQADKITENLSEELLQAETQPAFDLNLAGAAPQEKVKKAPVSKEKKKDPKKAKKIIIITSAVLALLLTAALVIGFVFFDLAHIIEFWWVKLTRDDKGAAMYVEERALNEDEAVIATLSALYKQLAMKNAPHTQTDMTLKLDSVVSQLINKYADLDGAMATLLNNTESIEITLDSNNQTHINQTDITMGANDVEILTVETAVDFENNAFYFGSKDLSNETLIYDFEQMEGLTPFIFRIVLESMHDSRMLADKLPSEKAFTEMAKDYILIAYQQIDDVEEDSKAVTVDGVKQRFTVYTYTIDEKTAKDISVAWLKETQKNKTMQQIIRAYCEQNGEDYDAVMAKIPEEIKKTKKETLEWEDDIVLETYADITGKVCGRSYATEDASFIYLSTAYFNKQAMKIQLKSDDTNILFIGQGKSDDLVKANGEYRLKVNGKKVCDARLKNYSLAKGTGNIILNLDQKFAKNLLKDSGFSDESALKMLDMFSPKIEIVMKEKAQKYKLSLGGQHILSLEVATKDLKNKDITLPSNCTPATGVQDIPDWFERVSMNKKLALLKRLTKAGLGDLLSSIQVT